MNCKLILGLLFITQIICQRIPGVYGGSGILYNDGLYYFGGLETDLTNDTTIEDISTNMYYLNLKEGFDLNSGWEAPWEIKVINGTKDRIFNNLVIQKGNNSSELLFFGGFSINIEESVRWYDIEKGTWTLDKEGNKMINRIVPYKEENITNVFGVQYATINRNDINEDEIIIFGGEYENIIYNIDESVVYSGVIVYNIKQNSWNAIGENDGYNLSNQGSIVYNGVLMNFGGINVDDGGYLKSGNFICFDIKNQTWFNKTSTGEAPEFLNALNVKKVDDKVYIVGGYTDESSEANFNVYSDSSIYILDLKSMVWVKKNVTGLVNYGYGYLEHYKDHLIYSFGARENASSTTQIISLKDFTLKKRLPSAKEILESQPQSKLPAIIGGSIGGFFGLILLILLLYFFIKKYKAYIYKKKAPLPLSQPPHNYKVFSVLEPSFSFRSLDKAEFVALTDYKN